MKNLRHKIQHALIVQQYSRQGPLEHATKDYTLKAIKGRLNDRHLTLQLLLIQVVTHPLCKNGQASSQRLATRRCRTTNPTTFFEPIAIVC